jgi:hypothetical protein
MGFAFYEQMPHFEPGNQEGRKRGPNKISSKVRESIVKFLEDNVDQIQESFDKLKPPDKLKFVADILSYAVPKMSSIEANHEGELTHEIKITWETPSPIQLPKQE